MSATILINTTFGDAEALWESLLFLLIYVEYVHCSHISSGTVTQEAIFKTNRKLFGYVLNCNRTDDKPYLLTKTSLNGICQNLNFKNKTEVMFGDKQEIESYAENLTKQIGDLGNKARHYVYLKTKNGF